MQLLRPLLLDNVPSIQQSAALALGRLANYNEELAEAVVSNQILPQLVYSLSEQNVSTSPSLCCNALLETARDRTRALPALLVGLVLAFFLALPTISQHGCACSDSIRKPLHS